MLKMTAVKFDDIQFPENVDADGFFEALGDSEFHGMCDCPTNLTIEVLEDMKDNEGSYKRFRKFFKEECPEFDKVIDFLISFMTENQIDVIIGEDLSGEFDEDF